MKSWFRRFESEIASPARFGLIPSVSRFASPFWTLLLLLSIQSTAAFSLIPSSSSLFYLFHDDHRGLCVDENSTYFFLPHFLVAKGGKFPEIGRNKKTLNYFTKKFTILALVTLGDCFRSEAFLIRAPVDRVKCSPNRYLLHPLLGMTDSWHLLKVLIGRRTL